VDDDFDVELLAGVDEVEDADDDADESFEEELDSFDEDEPESFDEDESELLADSDDDPGAWLDWDPRLSVLKKPDPLKVTPTGWNTFLTASTSPLPGWVYSVSESSVNACWTSMVSPVSTNL